MLSRYVVVGGGWKYLLLIELDFAMVGNDKYVSSINADDWMGSNVAFVS